MPNNSAPQSLQHIFSQREHVIRAERSHHNVWQDKIALERDRVASRQPASADNVMRSQRKVREASRSQKQPNAKGKAAHLNVWVKPIVKAELKRIAEQEGLSVSAVGAALLEEALRQNLHVQHAVLLQPIIEQAIRREMRAISTRLAWLLVRVAFDADQTRSLVTNVLGRQPGVTPEVLKTILANSGKSAKGNLTRRTPQITELIEAVERWMVAEGREQEANHG